MYITLFIIRILFHVCIYICMCLCICICVCIYYFILNITIVWWYLLLFLIKEWALIIGINVRIYVSINFLGLLFKNIFIQVVILIAFYYDYIILQVANFVYILYYCSLNCIFLLIDWSVHKINDYSFLYFLHLFYFLACFKS